MECFHLNLHCGDSNDIARQLQIILSHPSIRKLSLVIPLPPTALRKEEYAKLAAELVKFEEVDLCWNDPGGSSLSLLRSLTSASTGGDSKLKKLFIAGDGDTHAKVLAEARERFAVDIVTVTMISLIERDSDNDYSDDDYSDNDYSDDDYSDDDNSGEL